MNQFSILLPDLGDDWEDVKDEHGRRLIIGQFHFSRKATEGFTVSNECRDVFAAMELSGKLLVEDYIVHSTYSNVSDDMMLVIKTTSQPGPNEAPINSNSFGRVNKKFIRFFIDMLSLQLVFDNWYVSIRILDNSCHYSLFVCVIHTSLSGMILLHRWHLLLLPMQLRLRLPTLCSTTNRFWFQLRCL